MGSTWVTPESVQPHGPVALRQMYCIIIEWQGNLVSDRGCKIASSALAELRSFQRYVSAPVAGNYFDPAPAIPLRWEIHHLLRSYVLCSWLVAYQRNFSIKKVQEVQQTWLDVRHCTALRVLRLPEALLKFFARFYFKSWLVLIGGNLLQTEKAEQVRWARFNAKHFSPVHVLHLKWHNSDVPYPYIPRRYQRHFTRN